MRLSNVVQKDDSPSFTNMIEKIYIRMIDCIECWLPVNATPLELDKYLILDDAEFDVNDPGVLFEFYPGDIVEVDDSMEDEFQYKATALIKPSNHADRKYFLFKFKSALRQMPTSIASAIEFCDEINRVKKEIAAGQFVYRGIRETIEYMDRALIRD